jgi:hypothetical protein
MLASAAAMATAAINTSWRLSNDLTTRTGGRISVASVARELLAVRQSQDAAATSPIRALKA